MKLSRFVKKHIFAHNTPPPAEPAPMPEGAGGGSDSISSIAALIAGDASPESIANPPAEIPEADTEPGDDEPAPEPEPAVDELAQLKARLAELEGKQPEPAKPAAPALPKTAAEATSVEQLSAYESHVENLRAWALENWDGYNGDDGTVLDAKQVRDIFSKYDAELRKGIPAAAAALQQREHIATERTRFEGEASKVYSWIANPESEHGKTFAKLSTALKERLADVPAAPLLIADAVAGMMLRLKKVQAPALPAAPKRTTPPVIPAGQTGGSTIKKLDPAAALEAMRAKGGSKASVVEAILAEGLTDY